MGATELFALVTLVGTVISFYWFQWERLDERLDKITSHLLHLEEQLTAHSKQSEMTRDSLKKDVFASRELFEQKLETLRMEFLRSKG